MTSLSELSLPQLRAEFNGRLIAPGDPGYDQARTVVMGGIDRRPAAIVRPANADEAARVVNLARNTGLELAVRSGGHSSAGHSVTDGGIVLDLANLKAIDIDVEGRTAWAQTGLTAGEYTTAAAEHGLATGFGDTGSVGIGGITLGGGIGYLSRRFGLTIDDVLAAEVVTADGQLLRVDADNHPDLFWAIRGGGGNFGLVTRFQYRLHEVSAAYGGILLLPATVDTVLGFLEAADAAPEELSTIANVMSAPPMPFIPAEHHGKLVLFAMMCYSGPVEQGEQVFAPFRALGTPLADMLRPIKYPEMYPPEPEGYHPTAVSRNFFVDTVDRSGAETILDQIERSDAPMRAVQLRVLGGAIARVSPDATAYAHRQRKIMVNVASFYTSPEDKPVRQRWVDGLVTALRRPGDTDAYVNFVGDEGEEGVRSAYPKATFERLAAVKRQYDPDNLFRLNQNIRPA
ncbi:MAG TPA: FAD-binding oxidoreductase [Natronosporangium sp.]